jgi:pimeloyl-ACP methyl ester carboxylesterase
MLALLATLVLLPLQESPRAATVADAYAPGREVAWVFEQAGETIGHCASRYEGEVALGAVRAHHFRDQVRLEIALPTGKLTQLFTTELWTDAGGHPLRFDFRAQVGDVVSGVTCAVAGGKAEAVIHQGPTERTATVELPADAYLLANNFMSHLELLLAVAAPASAAAELTLFSANALRTLPYTLTPVADPPAGTRVLADSLGERLHLADGGLELVEIPAQQIDIRRTDETFERFAIELATRAPAPDLGREEVRIEDGDVVLAGTLTRPRGAPADGRLPAVFFLSGSGGQDRDGFSQGLDLGTHEIHDHLTRAGFLVLRVDDRGTGASTGPTADLDFADLVEDGRRAVRFLLARDDVDPERVALIGLSVGGLSAPLLALLEPIAAVVLLGAPGRPLEALLHEQLRAGRVRAGASAEELAEFDLDFAAFVAALASGEPLDAEALPPDLAAFVSARAWLASHLGRDPLATLAQVRCPVLILQGARDVQVSAERDTPPLAAALEAAGHPDHEMRVFPELDHLFKRATEGNAGGLDYFKARPVDPEFLEFLTGWLSDRLLR